MKPIAPALELVADLVCCPGLRGGVEGDGGQDLRFGGDGQDGLGQELKAGASGISRGE